MIGNQQPRLLTAGIQGASRRVLLQLAGREEQALDEKPEGFSSWYLVPANRPFPSIMRIESSDGRVPLLRGVSGDTLFHASPLAMAISRPRDGVCLEVNPAWESLLEQPRPKLVGKTPWEFGLAVSAQEWLDAVESLQRGGRTFELQTHCTLEGGGQKPLRWTLALLEISGERFVQSLLAPSTQQERPSQAPSESKTSFEAIFRNSPYAIAINRLADGTYLDVNPAFERLSGYPKSEVLGKTPLQLGLVDSAEHSDAAADVLCKTGKIESLRTDTRNRTGRRISILYSATVVETAGEAQVLAITVDLTQLAEAEEALRDSEERHRELIENSPIGIFRSSLEGRFLAANPAMYRMFGYESEEEFIASITDISHQVYVNPQRREELRGLVLAANRHVSSEVEVYRKDGTRLTVTLQMRAVRDAEGRVKWLEGFSEDITKRRQLEQQLRQAQKMEAIGTLAGGIAHDFNNILGSMICYTELASQAEPGDPQIREDLVLVLKACDRAKDLVRQILAFSSQTHQERKPVALEPIIKEALKLLRSSLPATIEMTTRIQPNLPQVLADPTQIHQVLVNLCANAAHAIGQKPGGLEVNLEQFVASREEVVLHPELIPGSYLRMTVTDTGHGMDQKTLRRIFEPFFTTKGPGEGTGLGLSVVHGIVRDHDGSIRVSSEPGRGTSVRVYLPALSRELQEAERKDLSLLFGHQERVLLVDDEPALCAAVERMLRKLNYQVTVHTDPHQALALFCEQPGQFDLILTDLSMPGLTGVDLAASVLTLRPEMPVVLASGFSGTYTPESVREMGLKGLLQKPVGLADLSRAVHNALHPPPS